MSFKFGTASKRKLAGVHPDLRKVAERAIAISPRDFTIVQGLRTAAQQLAAYKAGKSQIKSGGRHQYGYAIDFCVLTPGGFLDWDNIKGFQQVWLAFQQAGKELKIPLRWGGTFSFGDFGHVELPKSKRYPDPKGGAK